MKACSCDDEALMFAFGLGVAFLAIVIVTVVLFEAARRSWR